MQILQLFSKGGEFIKIAEADVSYPITKFLWSPFSGGLAPDLFATTGDYLRVWELVTPDEVMDDTNINPSRLVEQRQVICRATLANIRRVGQVLVIPNDDDMNSFPWFRTKRNFVHH